MRWLLTAAIFLSSAISPAIAGASLQCPYDRFVGSVIITNSADQNRICDASCTWRQASGRGMTIFTKVSLKAGQTETLFVIRSTGGRLIGVRASVLNCGPNAASVEPSDKHTRLRGGVLTTH